MAQQTGEEVERLWCWGGQSVDPVPHLQQHLKGSVLRALRVGVVQLQNQILDAFGVKVHAVSKHLQRVDLHVTQVGRLVIQVQRFVEERLVHRRIIGDDAAAQVDVHRFKEGLPLAAQRQCPVVTLRRGYSFQSSSLPVREFRLIDWHEPTLGVTAAEGIDVNGRYRLKRGVLSGADLEGNTHQHVDEVGLVLVAFESEQHSLSPRRIEPASQTHIVADVDGVDLDSAVQPLKQILHLPEKKYTLKSRVPSQASVSI